MKLEKYKSKDPKKIGITIFTVVCVLLVAGVFLYTSFASFETNETFNIIKGKVQDPGDLYFAFYSIPFLRSGIGCKAFQS